MPNYDVNVRRDWLLPLVGGAELNRIKGGRAIIFTSRPYPVDVEDFVSANTYLRDSFSVDFLDNQTTNTVVSSGELRTVFQEYQAPLEDTVTRRVTTITEGELRQPLQRYSLWEKEEVKSGTASVAGGELKAVLIKYTRWAPEELSTPTISITAGTLT